MQISFYYKECTNLPVVILLYLWLHMNHMKNKANDYMQK